MHIWQVRILLAAACFFSSSTVLAQVAPECDVNEDGVVDTYDQDHWNEDLQQANMLNFFAVTLGYSPEHSPAPSAGLKFVPQLELGYIPPLSCIERSVFNGTKTENTNKSPAFPRLRVRIELPYGLYVGLAGIPPAPVAGVRTGSLGLEAGVGAVVDAHLELGLRAHVTGTRILGDLAGPFENQPAVDDVFRSTVYGVEVGAGYRLSQGERQFTPYVGVGYTRVIALMYVGESLPADYDEQDPNQASVPEYGDDPIAQALYRGVNVTLGVQGQQGPLQLTAEAYMVPLGFRLFLSPRVSLGYRF